MRVLCLPPTSAPESGRYREQGYLHFASAVDPDFLALAQRSALQLLGLSSFARIPLSTVREIALPSLAEWFGSLLDDVSMLSGAPKDRLTLSRISLVAYATELRPDLARASEIHKDRLSSEINLAIQLHPAESRLALFTSADRSVNPFSSSKEWARHVAALPLDLWSQDRVELRLEAGDAALYSGASTLHCRVRPAGAVALYFKLNARRLDRRGVDPRTLAARAYTQRVLPALSDATLRAQRVELSPRLDDIRRLYARDGWREIVLADLGDERLPISDAQLAVVVAIDGVAPVSTLVGAFPERLAIVRELLESGVLDLVG